ncbi:tetratricopeptide repeat protein [Flavobacteriaceae sp. LMIT009]
MKQFLTIILTLLISFIHAQEKDKDLIKSNDYVYEGNQVVSNDFIEAEMEYRKAISKKPSNVNGSYNLGNAYYNTGNYNEALMRHLEAAKTATSKEEKYRAFHNAGNAFMKQNMCKEAVEAFKNALRNNPADDETRYNLVVAKECAKNQQDQNQDDKKEDKDEENEDKKEDEKKEENKDEGEEEKKDGDDQKDDEGNPNDEKDNQQKGDPKDKKKKPQQQPGKLSPQQIKNLLEAMNNEEKKVQQKINAKKATGKKIKAEKDW